MPLFCPFPHAKTPGSSRAWRAEHGETPTFWDLYDALPAETRAYVPRYIAVAEYFGAVERENG